MPFASGCLPSSSGPERAEHTARAHHMNRRHFFLGCFAFAVGCSRSSRGLRSAEQRRRVSIRRAPAYSLDLEALVRDILLEHRVSVRDKNVLLKPNLVEFSASAPINTNPVFVAAVAGAFRSLGAARVEIAEGPGHRRTTLDLADAAGYFENIRDFERRFTDLNLDEVRKVAIKKPFSTLSHLYLPETALKCDLLVSLPKMKTHHWAGATLAMKNLFGVVPGAIYGWPKNVLHWAGIDECIADLQGLFPHQFCLVDGIEGMEGNGPILGSSIWPGVVAAGFDPPSVDATCCRIMRLNPERIRYLGLSFERAGTPESGTQQIGETIASVQLPFAVVKELEHLRLSA